MIITAITTFITRATFAPGAWSGAKAFLFVRIEADDGLTGWGEAYGLDGRERVMEAAIQTFTEGLVGHPVPGPRSFRDLHVRPFFNRRVGLGVTVDEDALSGMGRS